MPYIKCIKVKNEVYSFYKCIHVLGCMSVCVRACMHAHMCVCVYYYKCALRVHIIFMQVHASVHVYRCMLHVYISGGVSSPYSLCGKMPAVF